MLSCFRLPRPSHRTGAAHLKPSSVPPVTVPPGGPRLFRKNKQARTEFHFKLPVAGNTIFAGAFLQPELACSPLAQFSPRVVVPLQVVQKVLGKG